MNYTELHDLIISTTQNNETTFVAAIDGFIQTAERRIHMEANLPSSRKNTTGVTTIGSRSVTLPTDYIALKSIEITTATGVVNLLQKAAEYITEMYPVVATQAEPKLYAVYDSSTIIVGPTPGLAYPVAFHYFAMPTSIVTATTTWLSTNFGQTLLYATLLEAYIFMKGSADVMGYYKAAADVGMKEIQTATGGTKMNDYR